GSVTCIVGPNGAGKSTVLRAISGLLRPRQGTISFEGEDLCGVAPAAILSRGIAQVPQSNGIFPNLTVRENVLIGAYILRRDRRALPHRRRPWWGEGRQPLRRTASDGRVRTLADARPEPGDARRALGRPRPEGAAGDCWGNRADERGRQDAADDRAERSLRP